MRRFVFALVFGLGCSAPPPAIDAELVGYRCVADGPVWTVDDEKPPRIWLPDDAPPLTVEWVADGTPRALESARDGRAIDVTLTAETTGRGQLRLRDDAGAVRARWAVRIDVPPRQRPALRAIQAQRRAEGPAAALAGLERALPAMTTADRLWAVVERARLLAALGRTDACIAAWTAAAAEAAAQGHYGEASRRHRAAAYMARAAQRLDRSQAALDAAEKALRGPDPAGRVGIDHHRGLLALEIGDLAGARAHLTAAWAAAERVGGPTQAFLGSSLAAVHMAVGRLDDALQVLAAAEAWFSAAGAPYAEQAAIVRANRAWTAAQRDPSARADARATLTAALARIRAPAARASVQTSLAQLALAIGDLTAAADAIEAARAGAAQHVGAVLDLLAADIARARSDSEASLAGYAPLLDDPRVGWKAWHGRARALAALGRESEALEAFQRAADAVDATARRAFLTADRPHLLGDRRAVLDDALEFLLARGRHADALRIADRRASQALRTAATTQRVARLPRAQRDAWTRQVAAWRAARAAVDDETESLVYHAPAEALRRKAVLHARRADLRRRYDALFAFLDTHAPLPVSAALQRPTDPTHAVLHVTAIGDARHAFWIQAEQPIEYARRAAADPLGSWAARLPRIERLYLVGGDPSLDSLPQRVVGDTPLAATTAIVFAPHLSQMPTQARGASPPQRLVIADPTRDLPHARAEGKAVQDRLGATLLVGTDATYAAVMQGLGSAEVVHFAGHGALDPVDPWDAHLRLAGGARLSLKDILLHGRFSASLVVLSGCETGRTQAVAGDRIGLPAAMILAGAQRVLAADRVIDDAAARRFFADFYADPARAPSRALRHATRRAIARGDTIWRAFRLHGAVP